jgi:transcriptional regulator with XRE-family HTH domain
MTEFGMLIKTALLKKNLTQQAFAQAIGCSAGHLSTILNGKKDPDMDFLVRCKECLALPNDEAIEFFRAALSSSKIITIDTSYLVPEMKKCLPDILVPIIFFPQRMSQNPTTMDFDAAIKIINDILRNMAKNDLNAMRKENEKE